MIHFPDADSAMAASTALFQLTGIPFATSPVVEAQQFNKRMATAKDLSRLHADPTSRAAGSEAEDSVRFSLQTGAKGF
jgi:hypothetical protein